MKSKLLSLLKKAGLAKLLRNRKGEQITILCLHRISYDHDFFFQPINPDLFENLVAYCKQNYEVIVFSEIEKTTSKPKLIFSFDDGYYDFIEYALPILQKYNVRCNHNVVNSCLNNNHIIWTQKLNDVFNYLKDKNITEVALFEDMDIVFEKNWLQYYIKVLNKLFTLDISNRTKIIEDLLLTYSISPKYRMMNWDDLRHCHTQYQTEIGSHTFNHESLALVSDLNVLDFEIKNSIYQIEKEIGTSVNILSLPNGQYNNQVIEYLKGLNIKFVLLVDDKINLLSSLAGDFNLASRIYLIQEPIDEIILRTEMFHSKLRKFL